MELTLSKEQKAAIRASIGRFAADQLGHELSDLEAGFLLDYFLKEIAPFAYNQGVEDAKNRLLVLAADLPGAIFAEPLTYWEKQGASGTARRKSRP